MGKLQCTPVVVSYLGSFLDIIPQLDYVLLVDSEKAFTTFATACAQAGPAKCLPVSLIQGNATGSDVRLLFTSTIDVSVAIPIRILCEEAELCPKSSR